MRFGPLLLLPAVAAAAASPPAAPLRGYVFRETDGGAPRRPMTVELERDGKVRARRTTRPDGSFEFARVTPGRYTVTPRFGDFAAARELVEVTAAGPNFAAVMLPRRRAGVPNFATVSTAQLSRQSNPKVRKKLTEAGRLAGRGDFAGAAQHYEEAAAAAPSADIYDALAVARLRLGRTNEARQALEQALANDPKYLAAYAHLASLYLDEGDYRRVAEVAGRALQVEPRCATGHLLLAEALLALSDAESAARHAATASRIVQGKSPEPYLLLARIHWSRN
ncbi:MAG: tetratricopeptide repeat protein, partial [Acidobacteria bacterium]|nr:tetratricopeptide repeat protein [Acidobacteriota bacterium]